MIYHLYSQRRKEYLLATGAFLDGDGANGYTHWTPYIDRAQGFGSRKAAKNIQRLLMEKRENTVIVNEKGVAVWDS